MTQRIIGSIVVWIVVWVVATPAAAVDLGLGLHAGTHGIGADFGVGITRWFGVRVGGSVLDLSGDYEDSGFAFDGDLELGGYGAFADFYPFKGSFRISAGFLSNRNEILLEGTATENQEIGDSTYTPDQIGTLSGEVTFDDSAPYVGIGYGRFTKGKRTSRVGFLFDFGVLGQGSGDASIVSSTGLVSQSDLDKEAAEIEEDIEDYDLWPVLSFGLAIRF